MKNDIAKPAIITVDSRSPRGINEKYFVSQASMRQRLQMKATLDQKDSRYILQDTGINWQSAFATAFAKATAVKKATADK